MENFIELKEKENIKDNKSKYKANSFINFIEEYYGYFKQFIPFDNIYNIGKVNRKLK